MNLEHDLRLALARRDPPSGFDDRVLSRIAAGHTAPELAAPGRWSRWSLSIAASLLLMALTGAGYVVLRWSSRAAVEDYAASERAAREVVLALQIASEEVSAVQARVREVTVHAPESDR